MYVNKRLPLPHCLGLKGHHLMQTLPSLSNGLEGSSVLSINLALMRWLRKVCDKK